IRPPRSPGRVKERSPNRNSHVISGCNGLGTPGRNPWAQTRGIESVADMGARTPRSQGGRGPGRGDDARTDQVAGEWRGPGRRPTGGEGGGGAVSGRPHRVVVWVGWFAVGAGRAVSGRRVRRGRRPAFRGSPRGSRPARRPRARARG